MIALHEAIEVLLQEGERPPAPAKSAPANAAANTPFPGEGRAILQFLYASYAVVLPLVLGLGLTYLFVADEIGLVASLAAAFALVSFTSAAIVLRDRSTETG